jgi:acyl-CoA thioesterase
MLSALMRALEESDRRPVFLSVHYLEPPAIGPFTVTISLERKGRSVTTVTARLQQEGKSMCLGAASFASRTARVEYEEEPPPQVPSPESCPEMSFASLSEAWEDLAVARRFEWRVAFGSPLTGEGAADTGGWVRYREKHPVDYLLASVLADIWLPAVMARLPHPVLTPTIQLSLWFCRELPVADDSGDEYTLCRFQSPVAAGGFVEEDGRLWDRRGRLLVRSRQIAMLGATAPNPRQAN